jgi:hypothetical protein
VRSAIVFLTASATCASLWAQARIDPQIAQAIAGIHAIDNHAHPVIPGGKDTDFDALPVDVMAPFSEPLQLRASNPAFARRGMRCSARKLRKT